MTRLGTSLTSECFGEVTTWRQLSNFSSLIRWVLQDSQNVFTDTASFTLETTHEVVVITPFHRWGVQR